MKGTGTQGRIQRAIAGRIAPLSSYALVPVLVVPWMAMEDLVIVAAYLLAVGIMLYQAFNSLEDRTTIQFDSAAFAEELSQRQLTDLISVEFKFDDRYPFEKQPKVLAITIKNKSKQCSIKVDWDRSALTDFEGKSRRIIRLPPDKRVDLSLAQVSSTIAPGGSLKETLTTEDVLKLQDDGTLDAASPIIDVEKLRQTAEGKKPPENLKNLYAKFYKQEDVLRFCLWLEVRIPLVDSEDRRDRFHTLPCQFQVKKMPWQDHLPFNPKK